MALYLLFGAIMVLGVGIYFAAPSLVPVLAVPCTYLVIRIGGAGGSSNLSGSDIVLLLGALAALPLLRWRQANALRPLLGLMAIYQGTTLLSVLYHSNRHDELEWLHQLVLVGGALVVGYVVAERHRARLALGLYVAVSVGMALWAIEAWVAQGLHPIAGLGAGDFLQKNLLGVLFAAAVLIPFVNPPWLAFRGRLVRVAQVTCFVGLLAVVSRQAMVGLVVAGVVAALRGGAIAYRRKLLLVGLVPLAFLVYLTVSRQVGGNQNNSLDVRQVYLSQALHLWLTSPVLGLGERFWYNKASPLKVQPPNAEVSMLATGGVVGTIGFLVLIVGALWLLWRMPVVAGSLGFTILLAHVVEGQFDIFWVTASGSFPWIIVGMSAAVADAMGRGEDPALLRPLTHDPPALRRGAGALRGG